MKFFIGVALLVTAVVFIGLLFSLPVMLLWNYCLVSAIDGVKEITWFQAWGILVLCSMLFKDGTMGMGINNLIGDRDDR